MSATSQYTDFSDLYTGLQNAVRVTTGVTATENQAKRYINVALQDMHLGQDYKFPWAEREAILVTQPKYTTGTLSVSQGGTTLTGLSTAWNTNNAFGLTNMQVGGKIQINGGAEVYEISAAASDTSATITSKFTPDTVSAGSYVYFEDEYSLASDFLRPVDIRRFSTVMIIDLIGRTEFRRKYPRNYVTGKPSVATLIDKAPSGNTTPIRKVRFHKPPDIAYSLPYSYITSQLVVSATGTAQTGFLADTDEPIVPLRYRHAILYHALYVWYRDKKDDSRSLEVKGEYEGIMVRTSNDVEIGASRPVIRPRISHYIRKAKSPYSRGGGRFDRGYFDEMGN